MKELLEYIIQRINDGSLHIGYPDKYEIVGKCIDLHLDLSDEMDAKPVVLRFEQLDIVATAMELNLIKGCDPSNNMVKCRVDDEYEWQHIAFWYRKLHKKQQFCESLLINRLGEAIAILETQDAPVLVSLWKGYTHFFKQVALYRIAENLVDVTDRWVNWLLDVVAGSEPESRINMLSMDVRLFAYIVLRQKTLLHAVGIAGRQVAASTAKA